MRLTFAANIAAKRRRNQLRLHCEPAAGRAAQIAADLECRKPS
jgi:hypothetical protein